MTAPALDHLILFLPASPSTNLPEIPDFVSEIFTLTPGGTHADGLTSSTLPPSLHLPSSRAAPCLQLPSNTPQTH